VRLLPDTESPEVTQASACALRSVATPLRKPWLPGRERSVFDLSNTVWNLAIGYPFKISGN